MDERAIKRLLVMVALSLIAIWIFKSMMSKTIVNLNKAAIEKKQAAVPAQQQEVYPASDEAIIEAPAASAVEQPPVQELSVASAVGEAH
jgi:hypothetical protein